VSQYIPPQVPVADFTATPTTGNAPLTVQFTDNSTNDPTNWLWDFGDGSTSTQQNPAHTYTDPGTYTVTLTVSNAAGSDTAIKVGYIVVEAPPQPSPPTADFSASPTSGTAPLTVSFTDKSTGDVTLWEWDFDGDGVVDSTERNPTFTYTAAGTYTVTLTVSGPGGSDTAVKAGLVEVSEPQGGAEELAFEVTGDVEKSGWRRNCGWRFVCKNSITITKVMLYGGITSTVTIWDDEGNLLAKVEGVSGKDGGWGDGVALSSPLRLEAGKAYRIAVYTDYKAGQSFWYIRPGGYTASDDIEITNGCYGDWGKEDGYPHILQKWAIFGLVNFKYTK